MSYKLSRARPPLSTQHSAQTHPTHRTHTLERESNSTLKTGPKDTLPISGHIAIVVPASKKKMKSTFLSKHFSDRQILNGHSVTTPCDSHKRKLTLDLSLSRTRNKRLMGNFIRLWQWVWWLICLITHFYKFIYICTVQSTNLEEKCQWFQI